MRKVSDTEREGLGGVRIVWLYLYIVYFDADRMWVLNVSTVCVSFSMYVEVH